MSVLRSILRAIANAEAVPLPDRPNVPGGDTTIEVDRHELTDADVAAVVAGSSTSCVVTRPLHRDRGVAVPLADLEARLAILEAYAG